MTDWNANRKWLQDNWTDYIDQWVAVKNGKLLGSASRLENLKSVIEDNPTALITKPY